MIAWGAHRNLLVAALASSVLAGCLNEVAPSQGQAPTSETPVGETPKAASPPASNSAPVIEGTPPVSVTVGTSYLFQPTARDAEGDALRFSVAGLPSWARFDASRGEISGSPADEDAGVTADIQVSVSDGKATASLPTFHITVEPRPQPPEQARPSNRAPEIGGSPVTAVQATQAYRFKPQASDPDSNTLRFSIQNKPSWASFSTADGTLAGTPGAQQVAQYRNIVITVSDGQLGASLPAFSIEVTPPPNRAPVISGSPPATAQVGAAYSFRPSARDDDGDALRFSASGLPGWLHMDANTGALTGTPAQGDVGNHSNIRLTVTDGSASATLGPFSIAVAAAPNSPPTIAGTPSTGVTVNRQYYFQPSGHDPEGQTLLYGIANLPAWASFNTATGALSGTPGFDRVGTYSGIVISVSDGDAIATLPTFSITVSAALNAPPSISGSPSTSVTAGNSYRFTPQASDPEGQSLTFSVQNRPAWASFNAANGTLAGTPTRDNVGQYPNIVISVSDGSATASLPAFTLQVEAAPNRAPTISGSPSTRVTAGNSYGFTPQASDPDGDSLSFSIQNRPAWATFNTGTGALTGTPSREQAGNYGNIIISVSDGSATASLPAFTIQVDEPPNHTPTISGSPSTSVDSGNDYSFTPQASDSDGDSLTFSVQNLPSWANFSTSSGRISGRPGSADAGTYTGIVIRVTDGKANASLPAFSITVRAPVTGSATLNWAAPTQNEDGSALTDLAGFYVYSGRDGGSLSRSMTLGRVTSAVVENLSSGTYCFAVSAYTQSGVESSRTAAACKTIP
ncbi:MAG: putative Ig domain-containing protein [Steroidobacteraceae bacterium]